LSSGRISKAGVSSRQKIENLLFQNQYDVTVVPPSLRQVNHYLDPQPTLQEQANKKQHAQWRANDRARTKKRERNEQEAKEFFTKKFETVRNSGLPKGQFTSNQYYLHERMRMYGKGDESSRWTSGNWKALIPHYGEDTAEAFRDFIVGFWRYYRPLLNSEHDRSNTTPMQVIIGLSGLAAETRETENWPGRFSDENVRLACRYAFCELNGFPRWFPKLYEHFPSIVTTMLMREIEWEILEDVNVQRHYILDRIVWGCKWLWESLAPRLLELLKTVLFFGSIPEAR
jgi:hypothetical protein